MGRPLNEIPQEELEEAISRLETMLQQMDRRRAEINNLLVIPTSELSFREEDDSEDIGIDFDELLEKIQKLEENPWSAGVHDEIESAQGAIRKPKAV